MTYSPGIDSLFQQLPQHVHGAAFETGDLHLGDMQDAGAGLLGHAVVIAQGDDLLLPFGQLFDGGAQGDMLHQPLLRAVIAQYQLERKAVLSALALDAFSGAGGGLGKGDLLRADPGLRRKLRKLGLPADALLQQDARLTDLRRLFLDAAADLHNAVVPQEAADLAGDLRHGIGGKLGAVSDIKALNRLEKAHAAELKEIVRLHAAAKEAPRNAPDEAGIREFDSKIARKTREGAWRLHFFVKGEKYNLHNVA